MWVPSSEIWLPKISKFWRAFGQLHDLIAHISGMPRDIVSQKMVLQTTDTPARANLIWCTLLYKEQNNKTGLLTHPIGGHQAGHCHTYSCYCCCNLAVVALCFLRATAML